MAIAHWAGYDRSGVRMLVGNVLVGTRRADGGRLTLTITTRRSRKGLTHVLSAWIILLSGRLWVDANEESIGDCLAIPLRLEAPSRRVPITGGVTKGGKQETYYRNRPRWGG